MATARNLYLAFDIMANDERLELGV